MAARPPSSVHGVADGAGIVLVADPVDLGHADAEALRETLVAQNVNGDPVG